ncbi:MAG: PLP-dependent cysteine synthase family protein [Bacteroidales bacterium]|nr:PLP-dependent cysteine synthase family protein [Bacteroidales bacterium]
MRYHQSITELIGKTPIIKLNKLGADFSLFAKCEFMNPISIKDRIILNIIEKSEEQGIIRPGSVLVEATSGNTGMALAYVGAMKGYKVKLYMSEIQSVERRKTMSLFGAELVLTPASKGTAGARERLLEDMEKNPRYHYVNQHANPFNPDAHYSNTAPEIWNDMDGKIDIFVVGLGTCGSSHGIGKFLKERKPSIKVIGIEPQNAPFIKHGAFQQHKIMGIGSGMVPQNYNPNVVDEIMLVSEEDAFEMTRQLALVEGMCVGITSGAVAHIMLEVAKKEKDKNILGIFADSGANYLSVEGLF